MITDKEMINLIKGAAEEEQFEKMSLKEMVKIYNLGSKLILNNPYDDDLIKATEIFKEAIKINKNDMSNQIGLDINSSQITEIRASQHLKILYCLTLVVYSTFNLFSVVGNIFLLSNIFSLGIILLFGYRLFTVLTNPSALDVYAPGIASKGFRLLGVFLIFIGLVSMICKIIFIVSPSSFVIKGNEGSGYVALAFYLLLGVLNVFGVIGIIIFESTRLLGLYKKKSNSIGRGQI